MKESGDWLRTTIGGKRGLSPQVGLILLFGMVAIVGILVLVAGMGLIDSLESESRAENTRNSMDVMDHGLATVIGTGEKQEVPFEDAQYKEDGSVYIAWVNASSGKWDHKPNATINPLGTIESELEGRTIAYQGGGIWEQTSDGTTVYSPPTIRYDNNSLTVEPVQIEASDIRGGEAIAEINDEKAENLAAQIEEASTESNGTNLALQIESEYHEGWKQHFQSAMEGDVDIDHNPSENQVRVYIEDARSDALFKVSDLEGDRIVSHNGDLSANATVRNIGHAQGAENVTLSLNPENKTEVELKPGESVTKPFTVPVDSISTEKTDLDQYGAYTYNVSTVNDSVEREFFLSYPNTSYYELRDDSLNVTEDPNNGTVSLEVGFLNIGENDEERNVTIGVDSDQQVEDDGEVVDVSWESTTPIKQQPWNDSTITSTINRSALPDGEYNLTVSIENDPETCSAAGNERTCNASTEFEIEGGEIGDPGEVIITEPANVSTSVIGTEISAEGGGTSGVKPTADATVVINGADETDGSMVQQGSGNLGFSLVPSEPDAPDDEPEMTSRGGWVATDGTTPEAEGEWIRECGIFTCWDEFEGHWEWDVDELEWSEDGGYELNWHEGGDWSWQGDGSAEVVEFDRYKRWAPVTASVTVNETETQLTPQGEDNTLPADSIDDDSIAEHNLNTFGTQKEVWNYDEENVTGTVSISSTYWNCNRWEYAGVDSSNESGYDSNYYHLECADFGSEITTAEGGGNEADSDTGFVMTRDSDRNNLPEIEEGYPRQRNVTEVFEDGTDDIELDENGNLTLGPRDFAFMMEVTMDQNGLQQVYDHVYDGDYDLYTDNQTELFHAAWDIGENYRDNVSGTNDPNYNDVIGFVQVDGGGTYVNLEENPFRNVRVDGESRDTSVEGGGTLDSDEAGTISVGAGSIVIS
ncbi:hypothetical protein GS429_08885 [Natronorubrum sp. JWXQ-INN-674]|uniref:Flagellin n=1 Tax=Natronorubrum halalkaliphilum TaxID=2691917 RepID=A0A6B0VLT1_9EURY|nr:hypothetical protein [Natronorubrum halalkaliphilum]MXV62173.1 hypothetical protein [Natronorubrum halalkaliphilum]